MTKAKSNRFAPDTRAYRYEDFLKLVAALGLFTAFVIAPLLKHMHASSRTEADTTIASR
jgi:hypothetical protein